MRALVGLFAVGLLLLPTAYAQSEAVDQEAAQIMSACSREVQVADDESWVGMQRFSGDENNYRNYALGELKQILARRKPAAEIANDIAAFRDPNPAFKPLMKAMFLCFERQQLAHLRGAPAAPQARRVQPQPAPATATATETAQDRKDKVLINEYQSKYTAVLAKYPLVSCDGYTDKSLHDQCDKTFNENVYRTAIEGMSLVRKLQGNASLGLFDHNYSTFEKLRETALNGCTRLAASSARCDLSSVGTPGQLLPSRVIARDGRRALDCVKLVQLSQSNSSTSGGGSVLANQCTDTVEI